MEINTKLIKTGDALLVHSKGFKLIGWSIRKLTKSYFNHVAFIVKDIDKFYVIEANPRAVEVTSLSYYTKGKYDLKVVRLKVDSFKDKKEYNEAIKLAYKRIAKLVGKKYDFSALVFLSLKYMFKGLFSNRTNRFQEREKFFCSESYCYSFNGSSSKVKNLFAGEKYTEAKCSIITPKDIGKSVNVEYICGIDKE